MSVEFGNGEYRFLPKETQLALVGRAGAVLLFGTIGILWGIQDSFISKPSLLSLLTSIALIAALPHVARLSRRIIRINDDGISVRDQKGNEIANLCWAELGRVSERGWMRQIVLWDKFGARRMVVDQPCENFRTVRSRILLEYVERFVSIPLPLKFRNPDSLWLESLVLAAAIVLLGWESWITYERNRTGLSVALLCSVIACLLILLSLHPQIRGPSTLFHDRIVLRRLFKTEVVYSESVKNIDWPGFFQPETACVVLEVVGRKPLKISSKFGNVPEMYMAIREWWVSSASIL